MDKRDWQLFAHHCMEIYDSFFSFDRTSSFIICPECGEPILLVDYPEIEYDKNTGTYICPICGEEV